MIVRYMSTIKEQAVRLSNNKEANTPTITTVMDSPRINVDAPQ